MSKMSAQDTTENNEHFYPQAWDTYKLSFQY